MAEDRKVVHRVSMADTSEGQRLALLTLQGLANRDAPRLYLTSGGASEHWLDWYAYYGYEAEALSFDQAVERFGALASGTVVYDPALRDTIAVAISLASARDAVVVSPDLAAHLPLKVTEDLRGRWSSRLEAHRWARANLLPHCAKSALGSIQVGDAEDRFGSWMTDLLVARRGFAHSLSVNPFADPAEAALCEEIMAQAEPLALALGWHSPRDIEATYVDACSRHGLVQICSSGGPNMSFHQHIKSRGLLRQDHADPAQVKLRDLVYITFSQTDGDALHSMTNLQQRQWAGALRGSLPLAWWIAPRLAYDLGPALLEYYYSTRTARDYFVAGPSGAGYNYPSVQKDLDAFLACTRRLMELTDTRTIWNINRVVKWVAPDQVQHLTAAGEVALPLRDGGPVEAIKNEYGADWLDDGVAEKYVEAIPEAFGFFQGFETVRGEEDRIIHTKPYVPTQVMVDDPGQGERDIEAFLQGRPRPAFVSCTVNMCGPMNQRMFEKMLLLARRLELKGYRTVKPDEFLIARAKAAAR